MDSAAAPGSPQEDGAFRLPASRRPRLLVLGDPAKPQAAQIASSLRDFLGRRVQFLGVELARSDEPIAHRPDLVVVLGGDGAMLAVARRLGEKSVPVLGVNLGRVGFLAAVTPERLPALLDALLRGEGRVETRAKLHAAVTRGGDTVFDAHVLNEVALMRAWSASMVEIDLSVDQRPVCTYRSDGLILATASGSTAYSLAAGGPILSPRLDAFVVTPIAPYAVNQRPLVLPSACVASLTVHGEAGCTADGREQIVLQAGDVVQVDSSPRKLRLVVDPQSHFYARLRSKLHWGEPPGPG